MNTDWSWAADLFRRGGATLEPGLTDAEVAGIEARFGFRFPPDLRAMLQAFLPSGRSYPDWRNGSDADLRDRLDLPTRGVLFDVEHNAFWLPEWGDRPTDLESAKAVVSRLIAGAPKLIPICQHRMMPDEPHEPGNPVFSFHQTDIICCGQDLAEYLHYDFEIDDWEVVPQEYRLIRFWDAKRFLAVRWAGGACAFDNSRGMLP